MSTCRVLAFLGLVQLVRLSAAVSQDSSRVSSSGFITVESHPAGAEVWIDGKLAGRTPLNRFTVERGRRIVRVAYPSSAMWDCQSTLDTATIKPSEEIRIDKSFLMRVMVQSIPSGAEIQQAGRSIGITPKMLALEKPSLGELLLRKDGYESSSLHTSDSAANYTLVRLTPIAGGSISERTEWVASSLRLHERESWKTIVAGGAMVVSGVLAAYFKDQANRSYEEYNRTLRAGALDATRRYDRQSSVALAVTQISFAALAYLLLSP